MGSVGPGCVVPLGSSGPAQRFNCTSEIDDHDPAVTILWGRDRGLVVPRRFERKIEPAVLLAAAVFLPASDFLDDPRIQHRFTSWLVLRYGSRG
jgi:hypothetical protein